MSGSPTDLLMKISAKKEADLIKYYKALKYIHLNVRKYKMIETKS